MYEESLEANFCSYLLKQNLADIAYKSFSEEIKMINQVGLSGA